MEGQRDLSEFPLPNMKCCVLVVCYVLEQSAVVIPKPSGATNPCGTGASVILVASAPDPNKIRINKLLAGARLPSSPAISLVGINYCVGG
jgi:hypothetical protein